MHSSLLGCLEDVLLAGTQSPIQDVIVDCVIEQGQILQRQSAACSITPP